jgi:hypothetical protein
VRFLDPFPAVLAPLDFRGAESGSGCEARRLSTGRSIRGQYTICSKLHANRLGSSVPPPGGGVGEGLEREIPMTCPQKAAAIRKCLVF